MGVDQVAGESSRVVYADLRTRRRESARASPVVQVEQGEIRGRRAARVGRPRRVKGRLRGRPGGRGEEWLRGCDRGCIVGNRRRGQIGYCPCRLRKYAHRKNRRFVAQTASHGWACHGHGPTGCRKSQGGKVATCPRNKLIRGGLEP